MDPNNKYSSKYLDIPNTPLFPFGYGLSYTTFSYGDIQLSKTSISSPEKLTVTLNVSNSGNFDGEETVQLYIRDMVGSITRPLKELKGFQKVFLKKGESKPVTFTLSVDDLKFYDANLKWIYEPGDFKVFVGGNSQDVKEASFKVLK